MMMVMVTVMVMVMVMVIVMVTGRRKAIRLLAWSSWWAIASTPKD
jgi:hypothetical protein